MFTNRTGYDNDHKDTCLMKVTIVLQVPIMDKLGRRPLLLYPMIVMTFTLALMTMSLNLQPTIQWMSYISIMCVILYVVCFAVGLGECRAIIRDRLNNISYMYIYCIICHVSYSKTTFI